jgi:hypothetical protein
MQRQQARGRGFTFVELCLGLLITTLVMSAMVTFTMAMARSWDASETTQALGLSAAQANQRLQREVRDVKRLGACRRGWITSDGTAPAAIVYWVADLNNDRRIQSNELRMLQHDPAERVIKRYSTAPAATPITIAKTAFYDPAIFSTFQGMAADVQVIARDVSGARFYFLPGDENTVKPTFEFVLRLERFKKNASSSAADQPLGSTTINGAATLRGPANAADPVS